MATYQVLYWHDIPVQVKAKGGRRERHSIELSQRFQLAVDNAAMKAGLIGDDAYLETFVWGETLKREGSAEAVATEVSAEIEEKYKKVDWRKTAEELLAKK